MTFEEQIREIAQAAAQQISGQIEERLLNLASDVSQSAAADSASVARRLEMAVEAEAARRSQDAVAAALAEAARERDAALAALRADLGRERDAAVAETRVEAAETLAASLDQARSDADGRLAEAVESARREASLAAEGAFVDIRASERESELAQLERLADAIQRIDAARSLSDVLDALADAAAREAPRVAVFVVRGDRLAGWRHAGFSSDEDPSRLDLPAEHPGLLSRALRAGRAVTTSDGDPGDPAFATPFGLLDADRAGLAVPVRMAGETVAIVYADDAVDGPEVPSAFPEALDVLTRHAARCLEVLTLSRAAAQAAPGRSVPGGPPPAAATRVGASFATPRPDVPPRVVPPARTFQPTGDEDEDSARRYARLLVSEIKLYHEPAVAEGRRNRNLLQRLRTEIDRAQQLYEERVPVQVRLKADFFGQELVRTLAGGDPALLGSR